MSVLGAMRMDPLAAPVDEESPPLSSELRALALRELAEIARRRPDAIDGRQFEVPGSPRDPVP